MGGANDTSSTRPQLITSFFKPAATTPTNPSSGRGIQGIFEGHLQFNTTCLLCEDCCIRNDHFLNLTVPVMSCDLGRCGPISVYHALNLATSMDGLTGDNKYWCSGCGHLTEGRRETLLSGLPSVMALHINRFTATPTNYSPGVQIHKTLGNIGLPLVMSFKQWTTPTCNHRDHPYQLFALICHTGTSCRSGHYTTVIDTEGKWAWFDDDSVTFVSHDFVINDLLHPLSTSDCTPYIVFYKRIIY